MDIFKGKTKEERYKLIAAIALGVLAIVAVGYNLIGFFPAKKTTSASTSPTATPTRSTTGGNVVTSLPPQDEIDGIYSTIPVVYPAVSLGAPDAGRNIFAFYEPPIPTPFSPTPFVTPPEIIKTPAPTPTPPQTVLGFSPATVYAGTGGFTLSVDGTGFTPDSRIFLNNIEMPTNYVGPQRLSTEVPSNLISGGGQMQVFTRTPDGKFYSLPSFFTIQQPPRPQFQYVGIVAPKLGNNATAYLQEGTAQPLARRLDDRIGLCSGANPGCFRVVSIARERVIVQDVALGFRYTIEIAKPGGSTNSSSNPNSSNPNFPGGNPNFPGGNPNFPGGNPNLPNPNATPCVPGIPCNTPVFVPNRIPNQKDVDDNDDDKDDGDN